MQGWVKLHRRIYDNPVVRKDNDYFAVWIYLLLNATHTEINMVFAGKEITLKKGQLITGRKQIAVNNKIDENKVERILKHFKIAQQIEQQTSNKNRLITILNWENYQCSEQQNEQQTNNKPKKSEQQNEHKQECINNGLKKKEKTYNGEIENFFESVWELYPLKKGKGSVSIKQKKVLQEKGYEEIKRCIERYVVDQKNPDFYKHGSTFFNSGYIDYLDENFTDQKIQNYQSTKNSEIRTGQAIDLSVKSWNGERQ